MEIKVLDHGYVKLVETWGSEERIIEAARMSTGKGFQGWGEWRADISNPDGTFIRGNVGDATLSKWESLGRPDPWTWPMQVNAQNFIMKNFEFVPGDEKLLSRLWKKKHASPFEMAGMIIEVQAPIFVFREWHRHRTQSYNEMSARYTPLPDLAYLPTMERLFLDGGANKQAQAAEGSSVLDMHNADTYRKELERFYRIAANLYKTGLDIGIPKEIARLVLPVARYSRMRASANLRNWLAFLSLRMAPDAQWEIRQYAEVVGKMIAENFPRTWELFQEGRT